MSGTCAHAASAGFTLVELSIVLVVVALLFGGILLGGDLIRNAELQSLMKQVEDYQKAISAFRKKYGALPGDLHNASSHWASCVDEGASNPCNGNANGMIQNDPGNNLREDIRAWHHLSLAGMVTGSFNGLTAGGTGPGFLQIGINTPEGAIENSSYWLGYETNAGFGLINVNILQIGRPDAIGFTENCLLSAEDAFYIDEKIDDGVPDQGKASGFDGNNATANDCVSGGSYNLATDGESCGFSFEVKS